MLSNTSRFRRTIAGFCLVGYLTFALSGCGSAPIPAQAPQAGPPMPTSTSTTVPPPTFTPAPTDTPAPTSTPAPTDTPAPTFTPTPLPTANPTAVPTEPPTVVPTEVPTKAPKTTPTPTPLPESVLLPIAPRAYDQDDFCGEVCLQEALLHFGKDVSQREINRIGEGDGVQGLWSEGVETTLKNLKFGYRSWRLESPDYQQYVEMLKSKLAQGHPVLVGVKINPTQHPDWFCDHFILLVGYNSDSFIYNSPDTREQRTFVQFRDGNPDGSGWTLTNPFNLFFGVEFTGE